MKQEKISIDSDTHRLLKAFCAERDLKIGAFVARLIRERIGDDTKRRNNSEEERNKSND